MKKENVKVGAKFFLFILLASILMIQGSVNSNAIVGWETFKTDYWQTGSNFEYYGGFDEGYHYVDIGVGSLYQPLAFYKTDVSDKTILVLGSSTDYLYAMHEVNDVITTIDTIATGSLIGQLGGWDKESSDGKFDVAGLFDYNGTDYFRYYTFNGSDWALVYNFTAPTLDGQGAGVTCRDYNSVDNCVFVDNNGTLYEVNIDSSSYSAYAGLGSMDVLYQSSFRTPIVESIRMDGTYQAIFQSNYDYDGGYSVDLVSWDLTNDQLDTNFGGGDGVATDAMSGSPASTPVVAQVGVWCDWILGLFPYNCDDESDLELYGWSGSDASLNAYLWDSTGSELEHNEMTNGVVGRFTAGDIGVTDCNDDGILDMIAQIWNRESTDNCYYVNCYDGHNNLDRIPTQQHGQPLYSTTPTGCYQGTGIALADLDNDGTTDIATSSGAYSMDWEESDPDGISILIPDWSAGGGGGEFQQAPIIIDFDSDSLLDLVYTNAGITKIYLSNATNDNPQFIGDGTDVDTCVPLCVNETMTFYARQDLDYSDDEGDSAYLGVDCYGLGISNITWSSLSTDPEVSCIYDSLSYWDVNVFITDLSHYPSYTETQSFGIYTAQSSNCYEAGDWQEECDPSSDIDELEGCFTESGISVCLVEGTSVDKCDECNCDDIAYNKCVRFYPNGSLIEDRYEAIMFDWSQCDDWEGSFWYPACPVFVWITNSLDSIWDWIFGAFWIFLTLILVVLIIAIIVKRKSR